MNLLGNLLIAPPAVKNNFWNKTVIFLTEHSTQSSTGLVLNKRSNLTIKEFGNQLGYNINYPGYVYIGGPVNSKSLCFLHSPEWFSTNTLRVNNKFSLSSAEDIIPRLSIGDVPLKWRLFMGMAGWGPGQLLGEIKGTHPWTHENSWCLTSSSYDNVFELDGKDQWCQALDQSAQEFAQNIL
jgi:putative transcriptional regulator